MRGKLSKQRFTEAEICFVIILRFPHISLEGRLDVANVLRNDVSALHYGPE